MDRIYMQREEAVTKAKIQSYMSGASHRDARVNTGGMPLNAYLYQRVKHLTGL